MDATILLCVVGKEAQRHHEHPVIARAGFRFGHPERHREAHEAAYAFESASESAKDWEKLAGRINRAANRSGLALDCRIKLHLNESR